MTPEPYPLTYADWKVNRAEFHLKALNEAIMRHISPVEDGDPKPYAISAHEEPEKDAVCYRIKINHPHVYIFLIASDALQNLRSALDHAVWSLVNLKYPDPEWTQFPIWGDAPTVKTEPRFMGYLRGLNDRTINYIKELQPYNRPNRIPLNSCLLWQLNELNRIEKHRKILVRESITVASQMVHAAGRVELGGIEQIPTDYGYDVRCFGRYKNFEPEITPFVVFGEEASGITVTIDGLWKIHDFVRNSVLPKLAGLAQSAG